MQKSIRRITVTGVHKLDIVLYMAYVLRCAGCRVLICDRTRTKETGGCIQKPDKSMELVRYREMDFAYSELALLDEDYDYILYVQDFDSTDRIWAERNIFVCDGMREHVSALRQEVGKLSGEERQASSAVLFRDVYHPYAVENFEEYQAKRNLGIAVYQCPHDCMDEAGYQALQFRSFTYIAGMSGKMEMCIRELLAYGTDLEEREIRCGIRMAKRGRNY